MGQGRGPRSPGIRRRALARALAAFAPALLALPAAGQPTVVATAEGQVGTTPAATTRIVGASFESIRGQDKEILLGGIFVFDFALPPPPEIAFLTDKFHSTPNGIEREVVVATFDDVAKLPPASDRRRNAADDGDFVAFSFATDGTTPGTLAVRLVTFDETGSNLATVLIDDLETFVDPFLPPFPELAKTGVAVDNQGRATVVYTAFEMGAPKVRGGRFDATTGAALDFDIPINDLGVSADVAYLDPIGNKVVVISADNGDIQGNIVDFLGALPVVTPEFPIDDTDPAVGNFNPAVAADPATGAFVVAWENVTAVQGDPVDIRARRFDAQGNPVGPSFQVNTTDDDAQGQVDVAFGPNGELVIVWAGDPAPGGDQLDVFAQAYDAAGNPIGGEIQVNTDKTDVQDKPAVRFLPEPDARERTQFAVVWRDVEDGFADGPARGTGQSYKCFSIDDLPAEIFSDGFESGDTSSWSTKVP